MPVKWHVCATNVFVSHVFVMGKVDGCMPCSAYTMWLFFGSKWKVLKSCLCHSCVHSEPVEKGQGSCNYLTIRPFTQALLLQKTVTVRQTKAFVFNMQLVNGLCCIEFRSVSILSPWKLFLFCFYRWHFLLWRLFALLIWNRCICLKGKILVLLFIFVIPIPCWCTMQWAFVVCPDDSLCRYLNEVTFILRMIVLLIII